MRFAVIVLQPGVSRVRSDELTFSPNDTALAAAGSDTGKVVVWDVDL